MFFLFLDKLYSAFIYSYPYILYAIYLHYFSNLLCCIVCLLLLQVLKKTSGACSGLMTGSKHNWCPRHFPTSHLQLPVFTWPNSSNFFFLASVLRPLALPHIYFHSDDSVIHFCRIVNNLWSAPVPFPKITSNKVCQTSNKTYASILFPRIVLMPSSSSFTTSYHILNTNVKQGWWQTTSLYVVALVSQLNPENRHCYNRYQWALVCSCCVTSQNWLQVGLLVVVSRPT